ncbi:hypothetical protein [Pseudomonas sp. NPDC089401]|uniref:hypothetical protein n=1 Tax=Pseudomonas sp. NPDC089401 TaxID=3364462 RepID=UPI00380DDA97
MFIITAESGDELALGEMQLPPVSENDEDDVAGSTCEHGCQDVCEHIAQGGE